MRGTYLGVILAMLAASDCTCGSQAGVCIAGEVRQCPCPDQSLGFQACNDRGNAFTECTCPVDEVATELDINIDVSPALGILQVDPLAPGDVVRRSVRVSNAGGDELRYAATSTSDEDELAGQLSLTVFEGACDFGGSRIYVGRLGSTAGTGLFGNISQGADGGDRILAAGESEMLCFEIELPIETDNAFQGMSASTAFAFFAEQTQDN